MIIAKELILSKYKDNIFETAVELRVSLQTVMASLNKYKIDFEKPNHIYGQLKRTSFSDYQKSILIGSILGDGHLEKRKHLKNALFREDHAIKQVEWLKWKHSNLKPFTTAKLWICDRGNTKIMPDGRGTTKKYNIQNVCSMSTGVHPYLTELYELFYINKRKVIPKDFVNENFTEEALLVLICDDGYYNVNRDYVVICTENFTYKENKCLSKVIMRFVKNVSLIKHSKQNNLYRIYINSFSKNINLINKGLNILPQAMHYKISPVLNEHQVATH